MGHRMFQVGETVCGNAVEVEDDGQAGGLIHCHQVPLEVPHYLDGQSVLGPMHTDGKEENTF